MVAAFKPSFVLRTMCEDDLPFIMRIEQASYQFPWTQGIFEDCLRVGYRCLALEVDGQVSGYTIFSIVAGECHILNICIADHQRSQGFGRHILENIISDAHKANASIIYLEVRPSNVVAIDLYAALGFRQIAVRKGYYPAFGGREDALILAKITRPEALSPP